MTVSEMLFDKNSYVKQLIGKTITASKNEIQTYFETCDSNGNPTINSSTYPQTRMPSGKIISILKTNNNVVYFGTKQWVYKSDDMDDYRPAWFKLTDLIKSGGVSSSPIYRHALAQKGAIACR